jgi:D-sedoheptulose 7-phosphate isomerase
MNYGSRGDLVIAISGSGNSPNVLAAVDWANRHGLVTFGLTGYDGGKLRKTAQSAMHVPLDDMGMVESIHLCLFHWVLNDVYARINHVGRHAVVHQ